MQHGDGAASGEEEVGVVQLEGREGLGENVGPGAFVDQPAHS